MSTLADTRTLRLDDTEGLGSHCPDTFQYYADISSQGSGVLKLLNGYIALLLQDVY